MFNYLWGVVYLVGLRSGLVVAIFRDRWLGVWIGLELNLLCFIPLVIRHKIERRDFVIIYFLTQACGSLIVLIAGSNLTNLIEAFQFILRISLLLKVGAAPFHFWYVSIASSLKWFEFFILRTVQKVGPLTLLNARGVYKFRQRVYISIFICGLVGIVGGIRALSVRKLLVYSSINHLGWLLIPILNISSLWLTYFLIYCLLLIIVLIVVNTYRVFHISQLSIFSILKGGGLSLFIRIISLRGLPPFLGFIPKWVVFISCRRGVDFICLTRIVISSVVSVYFYARFRLAFLINESFNRVYKTEYKNLWVFRLIIFINLIGFWVRPILIF